MSFCTSFSVNLRPIRRLTAYSVLRGFVTAWRLALAPTRISPSSWYATIEGVVRAPSLFSMTRVVLPSMTATHELVVPRSMPMILPIWGLLERWVWLFWSCGCAARIQACGPGGGLSGRRPP